MKIKRHKRALKTLSFFKKYFGFRPPYQVLVDGTFCKAALKFKILIKEQLQQYFESDLRLFTTACVKAECEALGSLLHGPLNVLRQFSVLKCNHKPPISATQCLLSVIGDNQKHYIVATQDKSLTKTLRCMPGVPLVFADRSVTIEAPSAPSREVAHNVSLNTLKLTNYENSAITKLKQKMLEEEESVPRKRRKIVQGPNPLSCRKKTKPAVEEKVSKKKRRKRKKIKMAAHVKEHLKHSIPK